MTPLLPTPKHYIFNMLTMTSPEAKRLWRKAIKEHFGSTCVYCGNYYEIDQLTLDHVHPKCKGGPTTTSNLVACCKRCNTDKGSNNWLDWMRSTFGITTRETLILSHIK